MFPLESIPQNFIKQLLACSTMYKDFQVEAIENNIQMYGVSSCKYNIKRLKYLTAQYFVKHYRLERLTNENKEIVGKLKLKETTSMNLDTYVRKGSFSDKLQKNSSGSKKLMVLYEELMEWHATWTVSDDIKWLKMQSSLLEFNVSTGKPINIVHCSRFCSKHLLNIWNDVREAVALFSGSVCSNTCLDHEMHINCNSERPIDILNKDGPYLTTNLKIVSIEKDYWHSLNGNTNEMVEKETFNKIMDAINKMQKGENLLLSGYPLLTQFNVGVIYLLASLFEKIGFINPLKCGYGIILVGFHSSDVKTLIFLNKVREICAEYKKAKSEISVLAVAPITKLCGKFIGTITNNSCPVERERKYLRKEDEVEEIETGVTFCRCVTEMNNVVMKEQMSSLVPKR